LNRLYYKTKRFIKINTEYMTIPIVTRTNPFNNNREIGYAVRVPYWVRGLGKVKIINQYFTITSLIFHINLNTYTNNSRHRDNANMVLPGPEELSCWRWLYVVFKTAKTHELNGRIQDGETARTNRCRQMWKKVKTTQEGGIYPFSWRNYCHAMTTT